MNADQIKSGDKVSKGYSDYTVLTEPSNGIFHATNAKGQRVTLSAQEVMPVSVEHGQFDD